MGPKLGTVFACVVALMLATGCGRANAAKSASACSLVVRSDAARILDVDPSRLVTPFPATNTGRFSFCMYQDRRLPTNVKPGQGVPVNQMSVMYVKGGNAMKTFTNLKASRHPSIATEEVSGIGKDALWVRGETLMVLVNSGRLEIRVEMQGAFDEQREQAVARIAVRRLGE